MRSEQTRYALRGNTIQRHIATRASSKSVRIRLTLTLAIQPQKHENTQRRHARQHGRSNTVTQTRLNHQRAHERHVRTIPQINHATSATQTSAATHISIITHKRTPKSPILRLSVTTNTHAQTLTLTHKRRILATQCKTTLSLLALTLSHTSHHNPHNTNTQLDNQPIAPVSQYAKWGTSRPNKGQNTPHTFSTPTPSQRECSGQLLIRSRKPRSRQRPAHPQ